MKMQSNKWPAPLNLMIGIAVILFSAGGTAAITGLSPVSTGSGALPVPGDFPASLAAPATLPAQAKPKCAECGVILSMRKIDARDGGAGPGMTDATARGNPDAPKTESDRYYEFTILMADRTLRWVNDENPDFWRLGERVIVIGSSNP